MSKKIDWSVFQALGQRVLQVAVQARANPNVQAAGLDFLRTIGGQLQANHPDQVAKVGQLLTSHPEQILGIILGGTPAAAHVDPAVVPVADPTPPPHAEP